MWAPRSRFLRGVLALAGSAGAIGSAPRAHGQACCAGTGAVTPGRLGLHEDALVGVQARAGLVLGSFDGGGRYVASPAGANELDLEQDVFGALRVVEHGQVSLLVPVVETWRTSLGQSEAGGGVGDINANVRYDFFLAGASRKIPGVAALGGVTFPTGTPPDAPGLGALATGATGIGAFQFNLGAAVEQTFGPWLVNATAIVAQRTARTVGSGALAVHERLGVQWSALAAVAYTFESDAAAALSVSEVIEGDAVIDGAESPGSGHRLTTVTVSGMLPLNDKLRLQGALFDNPQLSQLGSSQLADLGVEVTVVRSWK
jgi:hypothetical protein